MRRPLENYVDSFLELPPSTDLSVASLPRAPPEKGEDSESMLIIEIERFWHLDALKNANLSLRTEKCGNCLSKAK